MNIKVTLVFIFSFDKTFTALSPSSVIGILTTIFLCILAISLPSLIIPSASKLITSPLIGPSTIEVISFITSLKSRPSLAISEGLVVTPQITPMSFAILISATLAVSINNFISYFPPLMSKKH